MKGWHSLAATLEAVCRRVFLRTWGQSGGPGPFCRYRVTPRQNAWVFRRALLVDTARAVKRQLRR